MSLSEKINEFYGNFIENADTELEVRFGTKGNSITKQQMDNTINKLKSLGFTLYKNEYTLKIQPEFLDPKSGKTKISSIRVEIDGLVNIQQYCKSNKITNPSGNLLPNVSFTRKTPLFKDDTRIAPFDVDEFNFRLSLQKDFKLNDRDGFVKSLISNWESSKKVFRYLKRTTFRHPELPFFVDISIVKMSNKNSRHFMIPTYSLIESNVLNNPNNYEIEIEADRTDSGRDSMYKIIKMVLSGIQNSNYPIKKSEISDVQNSYYRLIHGSELTKRLYPKDFIGPSSISLEIHHLQKENSINILENYCVTDKADGSRKMMYINNIGKIYLIDVNMNIVFTGIINEFDKLNNTILDGEHIDLDKFKKYYNNYAAFDIYFLNSTDVRGIPFIDETKNNRLTVLNAVVSKLKFKYVSKSSINLNIKAKQFYKSENIFNDCASILNTIEDLPYETDGLIFTPSNYSVGGGPDDNTVVNRKKTWLRSFKWKPPEFNTIDFLVSVNKDSSGIEEIKNEFEDGLSTRSMTNIKEYKSLTLRVGFDESKHGFINPLQSVIDNDIPSRTNLDSRDNYKPVKFYPMEPSDIHAGECNILLNEFNKKMLCENEDIIEDNTIVEFKYMPKNKNKYKWVPIRVRYDKTAELNAGLKNYGNAYHVADSVWKSIHNPVTDSMLKSGEIPPVTSDIYYKSSDKKKSRAMRDFHNLYIKKRLIEGVSRKGYTLIDLAVGKGGDLPKWISSGISFVYGIDISRDNIENRMDGACARYLSLKRKKKMLDAIFLPGNTSNIIQNGEAFYNTKSHNINNAIFGKGSKDRERLGEGVYNAYGKASDGFDIVSCQFAIHYMFETKEKLFNFVKNVSYSCKLGGYFIGTTYDGKKIFNLLSKLDVGKGISTTKGANKIWEVVKQYESKTFEDDESSLGYAIGVYQDSINNFITEYLVNLDYLKIVMEHFGFVVVDKLEAQTMQLFDGITGFKDSFEEMEQGIKKNKELKKQIGNSLKMSDEEKYVSFLNSYFIFKKVRNIDVLEPEEQEKKEVKQDKKKKKRRIKLQQ